MLILNAMKTTAAAAVHEQRCSECSRINPAGQTRCQRCGFELSARSRDEQLLGRMIGPFRLEAIRRRTASGTAYAAIDQADGRWVELKVLPLLDSSASARKRRRRELGLRIAHPNLVRVLSAGEAGDFAYVATDVRPEERMLVELGRQPPRRALSITCELARALECVHEHGLVHRSLSPAHTLIDETAASVRLADLGMVQPSGASEAQSLTTTRELSELIYAAPETAQGAFSRLSDLYALGATLAFCLCGRDPFPPTLDRRQPFELEGPEPVPGLAELLRSLTDPRPEHRPQRTADVRRALQALLGEDVEESAAATSRRLKTAATRSIACPHLLEVAGTVRFQPSDFENLPQPLARAAQAAWNARSGLPRRMIAFLLWEGLARLLVAIGAALLLDAGRPLPSALLRIPFRPSFGAWIGLARDCLQAVPPRDELAEAARSLLFDAQGGRKQSLLEFLLELVELRNKSAHGWPQDEEIDLLSRAVELSRSSKLFTTGRLVTIESAVGASDTVGFRYQLLNLSGCQGAFRGSSFSARAGLPTGRAFWRSGRRFLQLDPLWIIDGGSVLQLQRVHPRRPRYGSLDGSPPRVIKQRYPEIQALMGAPVEIQAASEPIPPSDSGSSHDAPAEPATELDPFIGRVLSRVYRIVETVGRGAMGTVYRGWDTRLRREVALKLLIGGAWAAREVRQRFLNEARVLASLGHPHIVRIFEVGEEAGCLFFVMELLPGPTLEGWIASRRGSQDVSPASLRRRVGWIRDAARALHEAHQLDVVHRDIKPANLMLDGQGQVRVLDFGLAHISGEELTLTRAQLGTPRYMPPEQILDAKRVSPASDVYSLGMSLYALLSLDKPFQDLETDHDVLKHAQLGDLQPLAKRVPGIPEELATIVAQATQLDERKRYQSSAALADDLTCWLENRPISARPASAVERIVKYCRRHPVRAVILAMLAVLVLGMSGVTGWALLQKAEKERALTVAQKSLADFGRLSDLKRVADLVRSAEISSDTNEMLVWLDKYAEVAARIDLHKSTADALARQLTGPDSLEFIATARGFECAWMHEALRDLLQRWRQVVAMAGPMSRALTALRQQQAAARAAGVSLQTLNTLEMELVLVPPGSFEMGSLPSETAHASVQQQHQVRLTRSFYLGRCEVRQREFEQLLGFNPSIFKGGDLPVTAVSWYDAVAFCNVLSAREGLDPAYILQNVVRDAEGLITSAGVGFLGLDVNGYRLPTEAEWEYACRAGAPEPRHGELASVAWWNGDGVSHPQPGARKQANAWGLHDMLGNVAEWCWDVAADELRAGTDPLGPEAPGMRVRRGGYFSNQARFCRAAARSFHSADFHGHYLGFRVARSLP